MKHDDEVITPKTIHCHGYSEQQYEDNGDNCDNHL
jgi:hypothetical protein